MSQRRPLQARVVAAAEEAFTRQKFLTPIDVCLHIGWLQPPNLDDWRHGRVDDLDYFLPGHDGRCVAFLVHLAEWAIAKGLKPVRAEFVPATRSRRPLRFSSLDEPVIENAWRAHWISPDLPDKQAKRVIQRQSTPPDLVVVQPLKDFTCAECGDESGELLMSGIGREEARERIRSPSTGSLPPGRRAIRQPLLPPPYGVLRETGSCTS